MPPGSGTDCPKTAEGLLSAPAYSASVLAPIASPARWVLRRLLRPWLVRQDEENRLLRDRIGRLKGALDERDGLLRKELEAARDTSRQDETHRLLLERITRLEGSLEERDATLRKELEAARDTSWQDEENRLLLERITRLEGTLEERDGTLRKEAEAARDAVRRDLRPLRKGLFEIQRRLSRGSGGSLANRTARLEADAARQDFRLEKLRQLLAIGNDAFLLLRREGHALLSESALPEKLVPVFLPALAVTADLRTGGTASAHARTLSAKLEGRRFVVDLGCGTGEFLAELARMGVPALGVDADPNAVLACRQLGMTAQEGDLFEALQGDRLPAFDGAVLSHVVEHVDPIETLRLFIRLGAKLPEGGLFLVVTPNPESLFTHLVHFWRDPTHVRPYPVELLRRFAAVTGFAVVEAGEVPETSEVDWLL